MGGGKAINNVQELKPSAVNQHSLNNQPLEILEKSESLEKGASHQLAWCVEAPVAGASELVAVTELASVSVTETCHPSLTVAGDLVPARVTASETVPESEGVGGRSPERGRLFGSA